MGNYLEWLIDGLKAGRDRETVMADAAERFCALWGKGKSTEVNGQSWHSPSSVSDHGESVSIGLNEEKSRVTPDASLLSDD